MPSKNFNVRDWCKKHKLPEADKCQHQQWIYRNVTVYTSLPDHESDDHFAPTCQPRFHSSTPLCHIA